MKKLGIFLMSALAVAFTACDDYDEAVPQSNAQQTLMSVDGVTVAAGDALSQAIDLNTNTADSLELIKTVSTPALNEGTTVAYDVEIAADESYSTVETVRLGNGKIAASALDDAFRSLIGKTPRAKTLYFRFAPYFTDGTSYTRISKDTYLGATSQTVTPVDLGFTIESGYYIVDAGFGDDWYENRIAMNHSDSDVYDDPVFTITTTLSSGQIQFIGADESLESALANPGDEYLYAWGSSDTDGVLAYGEDAGGIRISSSGQYVVTINMMENTYSVRAYQPYLYAVGNFSGWSHDASVYIYERTEGIHSGYVDMTNDGEVQYKFSTQTDWNGINLGAGDTDGALSTDGGAGNLTLSEGGVYYFTVDYYTNLTYTATKIETWGLVGDATAGGWNTDTALTYDGNLVWSVTTTLSAGEYKFRANSGWDINLGGSLDDLQDGGSNISVTEAGTYTVTLDLSDPVAYKATAVKQ